MKNIFSDRQFKEQEAEITSCSTNVSILIKKINFNSLDHCVDQKSKVSYFSCG